MSKASTANGGNAGAASADYDGQDKQPMGRLPDGSEFHIPQTTEMLATLFSASGRHRSMMDYATIACILVQVLLLALVPTWISRFLFFGLFAAFRIAYNVGLGCLLKKQSDELWLVQLARRSRVFDVDNRNAQPGTVPVAWSRWIKKQFEGKMGVDYSFKSAPIEFNTWLLFRQLVDLVLLNDFTAYMCFSIACYSPATASASSMPLLSRILRYNVGFFLMAFNAWVKLDAHRVVKDYAWYWGDFFFLKTGSLVFDGVFNLAPHPMYSLGYAGYYGMALVTGSHAVFYASLAAHAAQMIFLEVVENPHIHKTYGLAANESDEDADDAPKTLRKQYVDAKELQILRNFSPFRAADLLLSLLIAYALVIAFLPASTLPALVHAVVASAIHTIGTFVILHRQSTSKWWTRGVVRAGADPTVDAFRAWKTLYNTTLVLAHATFGLAAIRLWHSHRIMHPAPGQYVLSADGLLWQTFGVLLIALHGYVAREVSRALGIFAWFYGDFFTADYPAKLRYGGIYRFLNDPSRILGPASFWGFAIWSSDRSLFVLASAVHLANMLFISFVERPHMRRRYGATAVREEGGASKVVREHLLDGGEGRRMIRRQVEGIVYLLREEESAIRDHVSTVVEAGRGLVRSLTGDTARERKRTLTDGTLESMGVLLRMSVANAQTELDQVPDVQDYSVSLAVEETELGRSISVHWKAPKHRSSQDWLGIYRIGDNDSELVSTVSSQGHWIWVPAPSTSSTEPVIGNDIDSGNLTFNGDQLPWSDGQFQVRYHRDGGHTVLALSSTIRISSMYHVEAVKKHISVVISFENQSNSDDIDSIKACLLDFVRRCYYDSRCNPITDIVDELSGLDERRSRHIALGIQLIFGVDFDWRVIRQDASISDLASRIQKAKAALKSVSVDE